MITDFVYSYASKDKNWLYNKYFNNGDNSRYWTFQLALNLVNQLHPNPVIIETGCQREENDFGGGMSTSIFAEYVDRYGGEFITVDNSSIHLERARKYVAKWPDANCKLVLSDSATWLKGWSLSGRKCDLLYLDSYDYPYVEMLDDLAPRDQQDEAIRTLNMMPYDQVLTRWAKIIDPCQQHTINEFLGAEEGLSPNAIILLDDNLLPGGGKPGTLKPLLEKKGWHCLLDYQQSVWIR